MERTEFSAHRVLVLGAKTHAMQLLRSVLGIAGVGKVVHVEHPRRALELLGMEHFSAVFCDHGAEAVGQPAFVVAARRDEAMLNPMIPIFVLQGQCAPPGCGKGARYRRHRCADHPDQPQDHHHQAQGRHQSPRPFIVGRNSSAPTAAPRYGPPISAPTAASARPESQGDFTQSEDGLARRGILRAGRADQAFWIARLLSRAARGPLIRLDLGLHIGQTRGHAGVGIEVEELEQAEAAGTC